MAIEEIRQGRVEKLKKIRSAGQDPYPAKSSRTHFISQLLDGFDDYAANHDRLVIAGRVRAKREHGGSTFIDLEDATGRAQVYFKQDILGEQNYAFLQETLDVGDLIEVYGPIFKTKKNEKTLEAERWLMLSKSLLPLPEKWHGLQDVEERYRKRYLDMIMNPDVRGIFEKRAQIIQSIRNYLLDHKFLEVQTPTLQPLYGGASARPFKTHMHALDIDLFLRIAPELYLKRLLVGGFERVFEFTTNFRNEGMDREHNPEFSAVEFYAAYHDYEWGMDFIEDMLVTVAPEKFKKPFKRITYEELMKPHGSLEDAVFKEKVRPHLQEATFVMDYPKSMLPLAKIKPGTENIVEAFQFYAGGFEMVKAFTELNDPLDQRERFEAQENMRAKGDEEAQRLDDDFIEALEYGMPPAAGFGVGIDRLVSFLTGSHSIREVILFPLMKDRNGRSE